MQHLSLPIILLSIFSFLSINLLGQANDQIQGDWNVVDVQAGPNAKLSDNELANLGSVWHFISEDSLIIENDMGIFYIEIQQKINTFSYLNRTVTIVKKEAYQIDLLDEYKGRNILLSFRKGDPFSFNEEDEIINPLSENPDKKLSPYGFDFSFEYNKEEIVLEQESDEIYRQVDQMPRFINCSEDGTDRDRNNCASMEMLKFVYRNLKYPPVARENGVEGTAVVTFVIEKDGRVTGPRVVRSIGGGCDEEALRVINLMIDRDMRWIPGMQQGEAVRTQFNLPVKFRVE